MSMTPRTVLDQTILSDINKHAATLEKHFNADVVYYYGPTHSLFLKDFRDFIEGVADENQRQKLAFFIKTPGGVVEPVEKMVEIIRYHFDEVYFVVPDMAMSAGTIFCMSGDKIYMDYSSSLGPIDPQVLVDSGSGNHYVPALGYLEQVERLIQKSDAGTLTPAEFAMLEKLDLAVLNSYEQAIDLSTELLKKWLVQYKFKDWEIHRSDPKKKGNAVTPEEKVERADEIAKKLGNHAFWHSHGRMIGPTTLEDELRLEIDDFSEDRELRRVIRTYNDLLTDYIERQGYNFYLHSRKRPMHT